MVLCYLLRGKVRRVTLFIRCSCELCPAMLFSELLVSR